MHIFLIYVFFINNYHTIFDRVLCVPFMLVENAWIVSVSLSFFFYCAL